MCYIKRCNLHLIVVVVISIIGSTDKKAHKILFCPKLLTKSRFSYNIVDGKSSPIGMHMVSHKLD